MIVRPDVLRIRASTPRIAMFELSVPLLVKYTHSGGTFMYRACTFLAHSSRSCAALPAEWCEDGLPNADTHASLYFARADGLMIVVAALSAYILGLSAGRGAVRAHAEEGDGSLMFLSIADNIEMCIYFSRFSAFFSFSGPLQKNLCTCIRYIFIFVFLSLSLSLSANKGK
jgi:hypothetical protein